MLRHSFLTALLLFWNLIAWSQIDFVDSVMHVLTREGADDLTKINRLNTICSTLIDEGDYEKATLCAQSILDQSEKIKSQSGEYIGHLNLGNIAQDNGQIQSALDHFSLCLAIANKTNNESQIASMRHSIGYVYDNQGDYATAMEHYKASLQIRKKLNLKNDLIDSYTNIGNIHTNLGEYPEAMQNYLEVLRLGEELQDNDGLINAHNNIGVVAWNQGDLEEALVHFKETSSIALRIHDLKALANATNNIGNIYFVQEKFDEAAPYYLESLELRKKINDKYGMAISYNNMGVIYEHKGQLEEALQHYEAAKYLQLELDDQRGLTAAYLNMGSLNSRLGNYDIAVDTVLKGIALARKLGIKDLVKEGYGILYDTYKQKKDFEKAVESLEFYNVMKDSLLNESTAQSIADLKIQYETEKKEKQNLALTLERDKQRNLNVLLKKENLIAGLNFQNEVGHRQLAEALNKQQQDSLENLLDYQAVQEKLIQQEHSLREQEKQIHSKEINSRNLGLWLLGAVIGLGSIIFYLITRVRKRKMDTRFKEVQEKALRAQLKPHFVFNAMGAIQSLVKQKPDIAESYLAKFSHFTQEVLVNSEKKRIPLSDELEMLTHYMDLQSLRLTEPVQYSFHYENEIDPEEILVPPAIFQPLVENSINHNFALKEGPGKIVFTFKMENGILWCLLEDDCKGPSKIISVMQDSQPSRKSFGRQIVEERLALWSKGKGKKGIIELTPKPDGMLVTLGIPL